MFRNVKMLLTTALALSTGLTFAQNYQDYDYANGYMNQDCCSWLDNFSARADVLAWKTTVDNSYWGVAEDFTHTVENVSTNDIISKRHDFNFGFDVGFRLGLGYKDPCCDDWNFNLDWTHFQPSDHDSFTGFRTNSGRYDEFKPTNIAGQSSFPFAKANLKIKFNDVWLTTSRVLTWGNCLEFEPFAGLDFLSIRLREKAVAQGRPITSTVTGLYEGTLKSRFSGVGIIVGLKNKWDMGCGISLLSRLSGGAAYGKMHANQSKETLQIFEDQSEFATVVKNSYKKNMVAPQLNFALGFNWNTCICGLVADLYAEWEYNRYFKQYYLTHPANYSAPPKGDLSFQGLTAGINVGF